MSSSSQTPSTARSRARSLGLVVLPLLLLSACRDEPAETVSRRDTAAPVVPIPSDRSDTAQAPSSPGGDTAARAASPWTSAPADTATVRRRAEVETAAESFFATFESNDPEAFRRMLSTRSNAFIGEVSVEREIWPIATEALGKMRDRRIRIVGGREDSVALHITGRRGTGRDTSTQELVLIMLRENGAWKVMYPGALDPYEHLRR